MDAIRKIEELTALTERLKQEAQIHAQEARTANNTIAEIYKLCTGATGEPGNWNGAQPVRQTIAAKDAELVRLRSALTRFVNYPGAICDSDYAIGRAALATQPTE